MRFHLPWTALSVSSLLLSVGVAQAQLQPQPVYPTPPPAAPAYQPPPPAAYQPPAAPAYQPPPPTAYQPAPYQPGPAPTPAPAPQPQPYVAPAAAPVAVAPAMPPPESAPTEVEAAAPGGMNPNFGDPSDHDQVTHEIAIAYFGITGVPVGTAADTVNAPAVGVRYWFSDKMGVDLGLGLGYTSSGGTNYAPATQDTDVAGGGRFAFLLHGGVPISVYDAGHFNGLIIPEANVGFATGLDDNNPTTTSDDSLLKGFMFGLGARAGAEWHLEFLDVPQATLQVTIGLGLTYESRNVETAGAGTTVGKFAFSTDAIDLSKLLKSGVQIFLYL